MKILILLLTFIFLILLTSCSLTSYTVKKYEIDPETGEEKLVSKSEYSYNMTREIIEADYNSDIMKGVGEQIKPHSKKDTSQNVYMSETASLAAMEIGGRYYQSKGYGRKWISSHDGTVVGSVTDNKAAPRSQSYKKIPGTISHNGKYYLAEDVNKKHPVNEDEAQICAKYPKHRKNFIDSWQGK